MLRFRGSGERWSEKGTIFRNAKATEIHDAEQFKDIQAPHRVIVMSSTSSINEDKITISELEMLLSWMLGGMGRQTMELKKKGVPYDRYHMLFPVRYFVCLFPFLARWIWMIMITYQ